jgi:drug/metabolite transporter (DMT)-like permease
MSFAWLWLGEPMTRTKVLGAVAVMTGVLLTRLGRRPQVVPVEE